MAERGYLLWEHGGNSYNGWIMDFLIPPDGRLPLLMNKVPCMGRCGNICRGQARLALTDGFNDGVSL